MVLVLSWAQRALAEIIEKKSVGTRRERRKLYAAPRTHISDITVRVVPLR